jgi:hypothetical protein
MIDGDPVLVRDLFSSKDATFAACFFTILTKKPRGEMLRGFMFAWEVKSWLRT